jgi:hypothetical protein
MPLPVTSQRPRRPMASRASAHWRSGRRPPAAVPPVRGWLSPALRLQGISRIYIPHQPKRLRLSLHPSWIGLECPGKIGRTRHIKVLKLDLIHKNIDNAGTPPMALGLGVDFPNLGRLNLNHCPHPWACLNTIW